ncbi:MAG: putative lyase [Candidatus Hinthialibacteria bacterium OLB16]|nr:MAG: putative lyase [Candidatus Hinthialibacteria bacterium OLB16]
MKTTIIRHIIIGAVEQEADLIAVLKGQGTRAEKSGACRKLSQFGTKEAVAPLAELLDNDELSHMARYGLETIPDPAVDAALREALGKIKGGHLAGVIGSVGVRRDATAIPQLAGFLKDPDSEVVQAAARALGKIGTSEAAEALKKALPATTDQNQLNVIEGLLRCADSLELNGDKAKAREIFDQIQGQLHAAHQVRTASLRGAVLTRGNEGIPKILTAIKGEDFSQVAAAIRTSQELEGPEIVKALSDELKSLPPPKQVLVIQTLALRKDAGILPVLISAAEQGEVPVRLAAIRALPQIGDESAVPVLKKLAEDENSRIKKAAVKALNFFTKS